MTTVAERVAKGAALLDEKDPGWWREDVERAIDLDRLNFNHGDDCILGQRCPVPGTRDNLSGYARYGEALSGLSDSDTGSEMWDFWTEFGITAPLGLHMLAVNAKLRAEWTRLIAERRSA